MRVNFLWIAIAAGVALMGCDIVSTDSGGGGGTKTLSDQSGSGSGLDPYRIEVGTSYKSALFPDSSATIGNNFDGEWVTITFPDSVTYEGGITGTDDITDYGWFLFNTIANGGAFLDACDIFFSGDELCFGFFTAGTSFDIQIINYGPTLSDYKFKLAEQ